MNVVEDEELRDEIEKDGDGDEVADGNKGALHKLRSMLAMEDETPEERGCPFARVLDAVARAEEDGDERLHDEAEASGAGKAREHVVEEIAGEEIGIAGLDDAVDGAGRGCKQDRENDQRQDPGAESGTGDHVRGNGL